MKVRIVSASEPGVAFFFSSEKGYLLANREVTANLVRRHSTWMIDNWHSLVGVARTRGFDDLSLEGPQFVRFGMG